MNNISASLHLCGKNAPLLTKEGWQPLRLTGWFSLALLLFVSSLSAQVPTPKDVLGFTPGDDRKLASWAQVVDYFKKLDAASDRMLFEEIGKSTMGAPFVYATVSSPENLKKLDHYREINDKLADPRKLTGTQASSPAPSVSSAVVQRLIKEGKTIVLITFGIHSTEVGSTLSSMLIAHELVSSNDFRIKNILDNTIILLVPSLNPDGVDIVKNWYDKTLGTPYEGTNPPELYHKYVGHDNNRDWYAFTQVETQLTVDKIHNVWHPQIVLDVHQQGIYGARQFLPPYMPPVEPNVPKQIVEGYTELGLYIAGDMRKKGFQGLTTGTTYDAWTPGRAYSHYHGGVRILSETASARLATPVNVKFEELRGGRGVNPHKDDANNGPAWKGGDWRLRNITDYMTATAFSLLDHAANNREKWLSRFYEIGKEAVRPRKDGELNAFIIDHYKSRYDSTLSSILKRAGVESHSYDSPTINGTKYVSGVTIIPMDQPYGGFAKALLENQQYPNLLDNEGQPIAPYDVTAHTLSLLLSVDATPVFTKLDITNGKGRGYGTGTGDGPNRCASDFRFGLYKSDQASMDEGWSRWIFEDNKSFFGKFGPNEKYCSSELVSVTKSTVQISSSLEKLHTIVFPDQSANQILNGYSKGSIPDEYTGGVGQEGVENLKKFVEAGGTLVFLNESSNFAIEQFNLPVKNITKGLNRKDFYIPGSILRTELDLSHPIAKGMPQQSIAWFEDSPTFEIESAAMCSAGSTALNSPPYEGGVAAVSADGVVLPSVVRGPSENHPPAEAVPLLRKEGSACARVIARYPSDPKQILLSGWALGQDKIAGKAALVEVTMGKGKIILFGFRPQYRGQSVATFPLLFNAISQ
ncbi:MAG: hypothetical protein KF831_04600 [Acidobacteria bacterium]|nr:hypothetical protein [Acidobacteriota bacterium]